MAKLKIVKPGTADVPDVDGYVNVVNNLILRLDKYLEFLGAEPDERPDLLQTAASNGTEGAFIVKQILPNGDFEAIDNTNCKIFAERDVRKVKKKSKVTVPMPDMPPSNLNYLSVYATEIFNLYSVSGAGQAAAREKAHKFMFGMMMLTRCR
ncbi:hypothetical protein [Dongia sp.]|jgi:hypothetical protein|uniref:hypothetical protein n=1 Tax=Dongia sp. TaxID=1977262 RepID=UPI0035B3FD1C